MLPERQQRLGIRAEEAFRRELRAARLRGDVRAYCRPEWFVFPTDAAPYLCEVKGQEIYEPPPFYGHGLPLRQVHTYELAREQLGLRTRLIVFDPAGTRYEAWLDELEARGPNHYHDTPGTSTGRRRIYDISGYQATSLRPA